MKKNIMLKIQNVFIITALILVMSSVLGISTIQASTTTGIELDITEITMKVGETITLNAVVYPVQTNVNWSTSNKFVADVDQNGKVTAISGGTVDITAETSDGKKAQCRVNVSDKNTKVIVSVKANIVDITIKNDSVKNDVISIILRERDTENICYLQQAAMINGTCKFTANLEPGVYKGIVHGITSEEYIDINPFVIGGKSDVISVTLNKSSLPMTINETYKLTATIDPQEASIKEIIWESDNEKVAVVDVNGVVTAVGAGKAKITATTVDGAKQAYCTVNVIPVTGIKLNSSNIRLIQKQDKISTYTLKATIIPTNAVNSSVIWSSDNENVAVVDRGVVTAVGIGKAKIKATTEDGGYNAECFVTVVDTAVSSIKLNKTSAGLTLGETIKLEATITPNNSSIKDIIWQSDKPSIASVDKNGIVTATSAGTATITAVTVDGEKKAYCTVKVVPVTGVQLGKSFVSIKMGEAYSLKATVVPSSAVHKSVTWSSDNTDVAIVTASGKIIGIAEGTANITAITQDGGFTAVCKVTVQAVQNPVRVSIIELSKNSLSLKVGAQSRLTAKVYGVLNGKKVTPTNKNIVWESSDESVATVDENGKLIALAPGNIEITARSMDGSNIEAKCKITVVQPIVKVTINKSAIAISKNTSGEVILSLNPVNTTNPQITWKSSSNAVAAVDEGIGLKVDQNGNVSVSIKGMSKGRATITFTITTADGSKKTLTCSVSVSE